MRDLLIYRFSSRWSQSLQSKTGPFPLKGGFHIWRPHNSGYFPPSLSAKSLLFFCANWRQFMTPFLPLLCGCHIWKPSNEIVDDIDSRPEGESASLPPRFPLSTLASEEMPFCDVFDDRNYHNHTHERCQDLFKVMSSVKVLIGYWDTPT